MNWDAAFSGGNFGRLYQFDLSGEGSLSGYYGGPYGEMTMLVEPDFALFGLNDHVIEEMDGALKLENRVLFGDPILGKGVEFTGGIFFEAGPRGRTFFKDFDFTFSQQASETVLSSLHQTRDWRVRPISSASGSGVLNGWLLQPRGKGNLIANDFRFGDDRTLGRLAKTNWEFDSSVLYFRDIYVETSRDGGGLRGDMSFRIYGIRDFNLSGKRVRLGDWMLFFGDPLPFQSLMDFDLEFDEGVNEFEGNFDFYETMIGARVQKKSRMKLRATREEFAGRAELFDGQIILDVQPLSSSASRVKIDVEEFGVTPFVRELHINGVRLPLSGEGTCELRFAALTQQMQPFYRLLYPPNNWSCRVSMQAAELRRGRSLLHSLDPFRLEIEKAENEKIKFKSEKIRLKTGEESLELAGHFRDFEDLHLKIRGSTSLESASYFLPFLSRSEGKMEMNGYWDSQGFTGSASLSEGLLLFEESPIVVRNVSGNFSSQRSVIDVGQLSGSIREGTLTAGGRFRLKGLDVDSALINLELNGPVFEPQKDVRFRATGPLKLKIENQEALLSGQLSVFEGSFRRRMNLRSDLLDAFKPKQEKYEFFEVDESYVDKWNLDIGLITTEPFIIRNNVADGAIDLNVRVVGTIGQPRLTGRLGLLRGRFNYFNQSFELKSGSVQFVENQKNIPRYDIRAETEIDEYRVFVTFQGDDEEQKIIYSSDPPLSEKEILALVSYGTPPQDQDEIVETDPTTSAAYTGISFVTGQLQDTIEGALSSDLGIRRFQLYPSFYEESGRTELKLTVGTDLIRNRLALNYSNFVSAPEGHEVELDFRLNRNISLVGSWRDAQDQSTGAISGDIGGDVIFRFEFE
jgi:autotransporter translocation and assembly factor TamB